MFAFIITVGCFFFFFILISLLVSNIINIIYFFCKLWRLVNANCIFLCFHFLYYFYFNLVGINQKCYLLTYLIGVLICSLKLLSPEVVLYLYKSTICPNMEYCWYLWAGAPQAATPSCNLELLDKLQKMIMQDCWFFTYRFFLNGTHSMQGWTATTRHGVTTERCTKRLNIQEISLKRTYS